MSEPTLIDEIPGYREAVERERELRESPFGGIPESICGVEVLPLTLAHMVRLTAIKSPFVYGGDRLPEPSDVELFLWCVSPDSRAAMKAFDSLSPWCHWLAVVVRRWMRWKFQRRMVRHGNWTNLAEAIIVYLKEAFQDGPPSSNEGFYAPYYSLSASMVIRFGELAGWTPETTMSQPLKALYQYIACLKQHNNPRAILFNPSDRIRGEYLDKINKRN